MTKSTEIPGEYVKVPFFPTCFEWGKPMMPIANGYPLGRIIFSSLTPGSEPRTRPPWPHRWCGALTRFVSIVAFFSGNTHLHGHMHQWDTWEDQITSHDDQGLERYRTTNTEMGWRACRANVKMPAVLFQHPDLSDSRLFLTCCCFSARKGLGPFDN